MKIVNVLLARIGSKRISKKPLVNLGGCHLIEWTLHTMRDLPYPSYVFSDSKKVRELAINYRLNARDKVLENEKGIHFTSQELRKYNEKIQADIIVLFQLTSPFRNLELVRKWIEEFESYNVNCALTARPIKEILYNSQGERIAPIHRSYQNDQILYKETGSVYIFRKEQIEKEHITLGTRKILHDPYDFDIDTYEDLQRAELYLREEREKYEQSQIIA